jgi:hypothetical protein
VDGPRIAAYRRYHTNRRRGKTQERGNTSVARNRERGTVETTQKQQTTNENQLKTSTQSISLRQGKDKGKAPSNLN